MPTIIKKGDTVRVVSLPDRYMEMKDVLIGKEFTVVRKYTKYGVRELVRLPVEYSWRDYLDISIKHVIRTNTKLYQLRRELVGDEVQEGG